jgi:hypothetical protein
MASTPQPSFNFHARIDHDTERCRRRLQAQTGFSAPLLVRAAFHEFERHLNLPSQSGTTTNALLDSTGAADRHRRDPCADPSVPPTGSSTELQLLLPFVTYCGLFPGICPLRSPNGVPFCDRCHRFAPGTPRFRD